jgi:hypothetical protein
MGEPARQRASDEPEGFADLKRRYAALSVRAEAELALAPGDRHLTALNIILRGAVTQLSRAMFAEARLASAARQARIDGYEEGRRAAARSRAPRPRARTGSPLLNAVRTLPAPGERDRRAEHGEGEPRAQEGHQGDPSRTRAAASST